MKGQECLASSLPRDVAIQIVSCLEGFLLWGKDYLLYKCFVLVKVSDACSLSSCSRFWREICGSDFIWKSLCKDRWPKLDLNKVNSASRRESHDLDQEIVSNFQGWKAFYVKKHNEMTGKVASFRECLSFESIDVKIYLKIIEEMNSMQFGFKDVMIHLLKPEINVLLNLIGLHYCIRHLGMQADTLKEVISSCKIQERLVSVEWCRQGWWINRFQMPIELHWHGVSLEDLATTEGEEVLKVLDHGITHEVLQIHISTDKHQTGKRCHFSIS